MSGESKISETEDIQLKTDPVDSRPDGGAASADQTSDSRGVGAGNVTLGAQPNLIGTVIDNRYKILSEVGSGGMGTVYKAQHLNINKLMALKVLSHNHAATQSSRMRFQQECEATAKLVHQNLVPVHDYGYMPTGQPYIVMDYVDGKSLAAILETGPLPESRAIPIFCQIADALAAAHRMKVIHRDLKPGNIIIEPGDQVRVVDFGIAKLVEEEDQKHLTKTGDVFGSPAYMSPEQCRGASTIDARSDIYSFGCVMYETLTGTAAHSGNNALETIFKQTTEQAKPFAQITPKISVTSGLEAIVRKSLKKNPNDRYQSSTELKAALQAPSHRTSKVPSPRILSWTIGLVMLFLTTALVLYLSHSSPRADLKPSGAPPALPRSDAPPPNATAASVIRVGNADEVSETAQKLWVADKHAQALQILKTFLDDYEKVNKTRNTFEYARVELDYGRLLRDSGQWRVADPYAKEAYETMKSLIGPNSEFCEWALFNYACCKSVETDPEAETLFKHYLQILAARAGTHNMKYAEGVRFYANVFEAKGDFRKAREVLAQALALEKPLRDKDPEKIKQMEEHLQYLAKRSRSQ